MKAPDHARPPPARTGGSARIIDAAQLAATHRVSRFDIGALSAGGGQRLAPASVQAADQAAVEQERQARLRAQLEQAWRDGYDAGLREGREAHEAWIAREGAAAARERAERFEAIAGRFETELAAFEAQLAERVVRLATMLARQTLRDAIEAEPARVLPAVREALAMLSEEQARPTVRVHPDDAPLVAEQLGAAIERRGGRVAADPSLERGDCRIECPAGLVDATLSRRWARALAAIGRDAPWHDAAGHARDARDPGDSGDGGAAAEPPDASDVADRDRSPRDRAGR